jgi:peptide/nickel transport system substrate-binding protein
MKNPRWLLVPAIAATVIALAACSTPAPPKLESTLRVALQEVTSNLDPAFYNVPANYINMSGAAGYLVTNGYTDFPDKTLYKGDAKVLDTAKFQPELATDWKLSGDGLTLTMNLRKGVKSPSGNELTSADIIWTAQRNIALKSVGDFGMTVANINKAKPVTADGNYTVVWHLTAPSPLLMSVLAWSWFAPIDSVKAKANATAEDPWAKAYLKNTTAFFGPYTVTAFKPGQSATLSLNENYWDTKPSIKKIEFTTVPDAGNRQQLVQRGEVDLVPDIPRSQMSSLAKSKDVQVIYQPAVRFSYLQYRAGVPELDNQKVRQALAYAIPYDTILSDVYNNTALPAKTVGTWLPNADSSPYTYNLDKAKQLLAEAGYKAGFTVNLSYSLVNPGPENEQVAVLIADSFAKIGVTVKLQKSSSEAEFTTAYNKGQFQMAIAGLSPGAPDAGYAVFVMGAAAGFQNFGKISSPALDAAAKAAIAQGDEVQRKKDITLAYKLYNEVLPAAPIANPLVGLVGSPKLGNIKIGVWAVPFWKYVTLEAK